MRKRSLTPLLVCAATLLICKAAFTSRNHFDAEQQLRTATSVPDSIVDTSRFHGEFCIDDYGVYEAGNRWAGDHHIGDVSDCISHSEPFPEDCRNCIEGPSYSPFNEH